MRLIVYVDTLGRRGKQLGRYVFKRITFPLCGYNMLQKKLPSYADQPFFFERKFDDMAYCRTFLSIFKKDFPVVLIKGQTVWGTPKATLELVRWNGTVCEASYLTLRTQLSFNYFTWKYSLLGKPQPFDGRFVKCNIRLEVCAPRRQGLTGWR